MAAYDPPVEGVAFVDDGVERNTSRRSIGFEAARPRVAPGLASGAAATKDGDGSDDGSDDGVCVCV